MTGQATTGLARDRDAATAWTRHIEEFQLAALLRMGRKESRAAAAIARRFCWHATRRLGRLDAACVTAYLADVAAGGGSSRTLKTIHNHRWAVSAFCRHLVDAGILAANPAAGVRLARLEKLPARCLSESEAAAALDAATSAGCWPEVALAVATGLRLGELARLCWDDVDVAARTLVVRHAKSRRWRAVPLNATALAALDRQRAVSQAAGMRHVFPARRTWRGGWKFVDAPRSANSWRRTISPVQDAVPAFRQAIGTGRGWHLLRHTFASNLVRAGVDLYPVAEWLGHTDVRTTRMYAHLKPGYNPLIELAVPRGAAAPLEGQSSCRTKSPTGATAAASRQVGTTQSKKGDVP